MSASLAVKYRPSRFAEVVGQQHVVRVLSSAAARQRPPQQVLLAGPSGLGKTTTARIFAAALLCEHRSSSGDCCGLCASCSEIVGTKNQHPDVIELDAASNGGKDEIRDLATRASLMPLRGKWKIYIVDEAHGLTGPGGQAFLRLLEEPPAHCLFILATTDPGKLPDALRGRCVILEVLPPARTELVSNLLRVASGEDWDLSDEVAQAVLDASDPQLGVRGTVTSLEKIAGLLESGEFSDADLEAVLGVASGQEVSQVTDAIVAGDVTAAVAACVRIEEGPGRVYLPQQLMQWAYRVLKERVTGGGESVRELFWFETFARAETYPGGLLLAVAQAAQGPAPTPPVSGAGPGVTEAPAPTPPQPAAVAATGGGQSVPVTSPEVVKVLNLVGRKSAPASLVLRKCEFFTEGEGVRVVVPPALVVRAQETKLEEALTEFGVPVTGL